MTSSQRVVVIGHPEHRRVSEFQDELRKAGAPPADVVSYASLLEGDEALRDLGHGPAIVRQDSFGQDFEVERGLLRLGYDDAVAAGASTIDPAAIAAMNYERGRIVCPRQLHCGFLRVLDSIESVYAERPQWRVLQSCPGIRVLFDKRVASQRWAALGIPVAPRLTAEHFSQLSGRLYVKLACGSSASCLALFSVDGDRVSVLTTIEMQGARWYNSRKLRRYDNRRAIERLWSFLVAEGAHIERALPKATHEGAPFDLRVVVIDGEPVFTVVRHSRGPITNLHLGGWRGDWEAVRRRMPDDTWTAIADSCRRIAADVDCFVVGVDILLNRELTEHTVIEGNAFGDLLPNLQRDGTTVYGRQVRTLLGTS